MVRAPFELIIIVDSNINTGQVASEKWYLAPLRFYRTKISDPTRVVGWRMKMVFGPYVKSAQYLGSQLFYAGKSTWRQS